MSTAIPDLWPDDIKSDDVLTPEEILQHQALRLEERTNSLIVGHVEKLVSEDRVVLGFEIESPRIDRRHRLFEVQHQLDFEHPALIVPPDEELPSYLKDRIYKPGLALGAVKAAVTVSGYSVENEWLATSPGKFSELVSKVLALTTVKSVVLSLISRAHRANGDKNGENQPS